MKTSPLYDIHNIAEIAFSPKGEKTIPLHYGNVEHEYWRVRQKAGMADISHWSLITLRGPDRKSFLHGMVTNEVNRLPLNRGNYSLILTNQGKIIAECWVIQRQDDIVLICRSDNADEVYQILEKYHIMEDLEINIHERDYALLAVQGPHVRDILKSLSPDGEFPGSEYTHSTCSIQDVPLSMIQVSCTGEEGFLIVVESEKAPSLWNIMKEHEIKPFGLQALDMLRMEAGIPVWGRELDQSIIPQEACLHHALNFQKGCFIGQEVVARLHYRGHVNRELTGFILPKDVEITNQITLHAEGKTVGKITSINELPGMNKTIALGYLRCKLREDGKDIEAKCGNQTFSVQVHSLPFVECPHTPMTFSAESTE